MLLGGTEAGAGAGDGAVFHPSSVKVVVLTVFPFESTKIPTGGKKTVVVPVKWVVVT